MSINGINWSHSINREMFAVWLREHVNKTGTPPGRVPVRRPGQRR